MKGKERVSRKLKALRLRINVKFRFITITISKKDFIVSITIITTNINPSTTRYSYSEWLVFYPVKIKIHLFSC